MTSLGILRLCFEKDSAGRAVLRVIMIMIMITPPGGRRVTDRCAPKTLDHVWGTSVNAGEEAPCARSLHLCRRFSPQMIQGETRWGTPLTPWPVGCYSRRRDRALGDVSRIRIKKPLRRVPRGAGPGNCILMDQEVSCQVALYGTCKRWPAPLPFPSRGGSVSFPF